MNKALLIVAVAVMSGCSTIKTVDQALSKAAVLATGPCAEAVHNAVAVCNAK